MGEIVTTNTEPVTKAEPKPEYVWFNENQNRKKILDLVIAGKTSEQIQKELSIKEHTVVYTMNHPHFINKLNKKLQVLYTLLVVDKVRIQSELLSLLYGSLRKTIAVKDRVNMTDEKIVKELVNITKTETNKIKISKVEKNTSFTFNNNQGKERPKSLEKEAADEKELLQSFGIETEEAIIEEDNGGE